MEFLQKVIQLYAERKEWFLDLFAAHVGLALTAAVSAGIIGLLLGIFISEHKKAAGPVLTIANIGYTIPAISLLGMLIPVLGIGDKTAITLRFTASCRWCEIRMRELPASGKK